MARTIPFVKCDRPSSIATFCTRAFILGCTLAFVSNGTARADELEWIKVSKDKKGFQLSTSGKPFTPWGFNYDHDGQGRLIEQYWHQEWSKIEEDFSEMKQLGANVVRIHLQFNEFMLGPGKPNLKALDQLDRLVDLAERLHLYLDLTGLACYHKQDVPGWYDALEEAARWKAQEQFWEAIAQRCANSPAIFCYDLMNEPVVPGGRRKNRDWLGPPFADKYFVQFITLDQAKRPRSKVAKQWIHQLAAAIRKHDRRHLITVGLVHWSLDKPGLTSGFDPQVIISEVDFISVHLYPKKEELEEALNTLKGFSLGKPVVIEETFPLKCSLEELEQFFDKSQTDAAGWIGFYWGQTIEDLQQPKTFGEAVTRSWLEFFQKRAKEIHSQNADNSD